MNKGADAEAVKLLEWAQEHVDKGYDYLWIYKTVVEQLERLDLTPAEFNHFERRLSKLTKTNE